MEEVVAVGATQEVMSPFPALILTLGSQGPMNCAAFSLLCPNAKLFCPGADQPRTTTMSQNKSLLLTVALRCFPPVMRRVTTRRAIRRAIGWRKDALGAPLVQDCATNKEALTFPSPQHPALSLTNQFFPPIAGLTSTLAA